LWQGFKYQPVSIYVGNIIPGFKVRDTILTLQYQPILLIRSILILKNTDSYWYHTKIVIQTLWVTLSWTIL